MTTTIRSVFQKEFLSAWKGPGITIKCWDGKTATAGAGSRTLTVTIKKADVIREIVRNPSLGFGHAYTRGDIVVDGDLQTFLRAVFAMPENKGRELMDAAIHALRREAAPSHSEDNARFHYDTGNAFFKKWLDPSMTYSCAYFGTERDSLAAAQEQKHELLCRKLDLKPGQTLLDMGCGWGALLFHAVERHGVIGVGVTPSREQAAYIEEEAARRGVADKIAVRSTDWRKVGDQFDRVACVGMFEHVGKEHGREFFIKWKRWLKPGGVSVLQTIGAMESMPPVPWITEAIFPGGYLPSLAELAAHASAANLVVEDVENLWRHYVLTLAAWAENFDAARDDIRKTTSEEFCRAWWLYLNASEAAFAAGRLMLWQIVLGSGKRLSQPLTRKSWTGFRDLPWPQSLPGQLPHVPIGTVAVPNWH